MNVINVHRNGKAHKENNHQHQDRFSFFIFSDTKI